MKKHYTNNVQIYSNNYEIEIFFRVGLNRPEDVQVDTGKPWQQFEDLCSVVMSPQHAKSFLMVLGHVVGGYEQRFGVLNAADSTFMEHGGGVGGRGVN